MKRVLLASLVLAVAITGIATAQMGKPEMVSLSGKVIDLTCSAKGQTMMSSWGNAENDEHMTPDGAKPGCATMCLQGGQPAALFADNSIKAVFGCNPRATLSEYAAQDVEVMGFWAGGADDATKTFVPAKIRTDGGDWNDVNCATMH